VDFAGPRGRMDDTGWHLLHAQRISRIEFEYYLGLRRTRMPEEGGDGRMVHEAADLQISSSFAVSQRLNFFICGGHHLSLACQFDIE
jgi:hypothetical protein